MYRVAKYEANSDRSEFESKTGIDRKAKNLDRFIFLAELMASRDVAGNRRVLNTAEFNKGLFMANLEARYSARDIETRILAALRTAGLNPEQRLSPVKLGALDHFHTGGLQASLRLQELAQIRAEDRVLDIGARLTGPARMLANI